MSDLVGVDLTLLAEDLHHVPHYVRFHPDTKVERLDKVLAQVRGGTADTSDARSIRRGYNTIHLNSFSGFSFDELCKLFYSAHGALDESVLNLFTTQPQYEVVSAIVRSLKDYAVNADEKGSWNEVVDAYNCIRSFCLTHHPDFTVRLELQPAGQAYGHSKFSDVFVAGMFGFLVYFRGSHVMTLGFSIAPGRRLLLQQMQNANRKNNKFLDHLPQNRLEFVLERLFASFSGYKLYIIDGASDADRSLADYRTSLEEARVAGNEAEYAYYQTKIEHLSAHRDRIAKLYRKTGRFALGTAPLCVQDLVHFQVLSAQEVRKAS